MLLFGFLVYVLFASGEPSYWEGDIAAFERRDISNPPEKGGMEEMVLQDPFDYQAEDQLLAAWQRANALRPDNIFVEEPGVGLSYSGPGGRQRSNSEFE